MYPPTGRAESAEGDGKEGVLSPAGPGRGGLPPPLPPASLSAGDSPPQTTPPGQRSREETLQETSGALPGHRLLWSCESPSLYLYFQLLLCVAELLKGACFPSKKWLDHEKGLQQLQQSVAEGRLGEEERREGEREVRELVTSLTSSWEAKHGGLMAATVLLPGASPAFMEKMKVEVPILMEYDESRVKLATNL